MRESAGAKPRRRARVLWRAVFGACLALGPLGLFGVARAGAATTPTVTVSTSVTGTSVTLTATVTNPATIGKVHFQVVATNQGNGATRWVTGAGPTYVLSLSGLSQTTYSVTATYKYKVGTLAKTTSVVKTFTIGSSTPPIVATTTSLKVFAPGTTTAVSSVVQGATVTLVATLKTTKGTPVTVGTVEFETLGKTPPLVIGLVALNGSNTVRYPRGSWVQGSYTIEAKYLGRLTAQPEYAGSHGTASVTCTAPVSTIVNTTTSLSLKVTTKGTTTAVTTIQAGSVVTLVSSVTTAAVPPQPVTVGTVEFMTTSSGSVLGLVRLNGTDTARLQKGSWLAGTYHLEALYLGLLTGTVQYLSASASATLTCTGTTTTLVATTTTMVISGGAGSISQFAKTVAVSLTATVKTATGLVVTKGTVQFKTASGTVIGTAAVGSNGTATITNVGAWPVGSYTVQANFSGPTYLPSQASASIQVLASKSATTTQLTVSPSSVILGQKVTLHATVAFQAPSTGVTGTVTFEVTGTAVGSAPLVGGSATFSYTAAAAGTLHVVALYSGDAVNLSSTSTEAQLTVTDVVPTTTTVTASNQVVTPSQKVTFHAVVAATSAPGAPVAGTPTGTVTFHETTKTGPALSGCSGMALVTGAATCNVTGLGGNGSQTVVAVYTPTTATSFEASTGSATVCVVSWSCRGSTSTQGNTNTQGNNNDDQGNDNSPRVSHVARDDGNTNSQGTNSQGNTDGDTDGDDQGQGWSQCWHGSRGWNGWTSQTDNSQTQDDSWHQWNGTANQDDGGNGGLGHGVIAGAPRS